VPPRVAHAVGNDQVTATCPLGLAAELDALLDGVDGTFGVVVESPGTRESFRRNDTRSFRSASVYKLFLAAIVLSKVEAGSINLTQSLTITEDDAFEAEPAGGAELGQEMTVREALTSMMGVSSSSAAFALLRLLGRPSFNQALSDLGLRNTRVPEVDPAQTGGGGSSTGAVTTPAGTAYLVRLLMDGSLLRAAGAAEMRALLKIPEDLDAVIYSLPDDAEVYTKIGELEDASNVAGWIVTPGGPVILSVFSEGTDPGSARSMIGQIARAVYACGAAT